MTAINQVIFESISDIPEYLNNNPSLHDGSGRGGAGRTDWDGGLGFDGAMNMAADGGYWEEGAAMMMEATSEAIELKREGAAPEFEWGVTGARLDVDEYLSGSPECWEYVEEDNTAPVISIGVQLYTPGGNPMSTYVNRGAALLSVIDDLEAQGVRVELWGCVSGIHRRGRDVAIDMRVCLKRAEEAWSPSSIAFGLCHPAMSRRLGFSVVEGFANMKRYCATGHSLDFDNDRPIDSEFDVWFGYRSMLSTCKYDSVKRALGAVTYEVKRQLKDNKYMAIEETA
jgi:hypothetical protein